MHRLILSLLVLLVSLLPWSLHAQVLPILPPENYDWVTFDLAVEGQFGGVFAEDINANSDVVGWAFGGNGQIAFLRQNGGHLTTITCPDGLIAQVTSVNRSGEVSGTCPEPTTRLPQGIILRPTRGGRANPTIITVPGASQTFGHGINDWGHVVGIYYDAQGSGPLPYFAANGQYMPLTNTLAPGVGTIAESVTNWGAIVGHYLDPQRPPSRTHGWLYFWGTSQAFDVPAMLDTFVWDLNENWQAVGTFRDPDFQGHSFYYENTGTFYEIQSPDPAVIFTDVSGLNNEGQLVGRVLLVHPEDPTQILSRGFVATPLPASLLGGQTATAAQSRASTGGRPVQHPRRSLRLNLASCDEDATQVVPLKLRPQLGCR
jgi:hypothetical protein